MVAWLPDGREIAFDHDHPKAWLVYFMVPAMLRRSGLSAHTLPSLVPRQKFLCGSAKEWTAAVADCIAEQAPAAHRSLCRMERDVGDLRALPANQAQPARRSGRAEPGVAVAHPSEAGDRGRCHARRCGIFDAAARTLEKRAVIESCERGFLSVPDWLSFSRTFRLPDCITPSAPRSAGFL